MKKLMSRFLSFSFLVQLILLLCLLGTCINIRLIARDVLFGSVLLRLHVAFLILYAGQVGFILTREKYVCLLTLVQGIMALLTTADFIFVPILQVVGRSYYALLNPSVEALKVYQYVFVSAAFTLQMASAAYLWVTFKRK